RSWGLVPARNSNGGPPITAKAAERLALEFGARLTSHGDRQMLDRPQARPSAPLDLRFVYGQLQFRPPPKQGLERAYSLDACELMPQTEMNAGAEGDMPVRPALEINLLRMRIGLRIEVRGHQHGNDLLALLQPDTADLELPVAVAGLGDLHGREEPQEFLESEMAPAPFFFWPVTQSGFFQELMHRAADEMRGGFVPREQQQEDHRHHLVAADLTAVLLDAHQLGNQPLAATFARDLQLLLQVAPHRVKTHDNLRNHADEPDGAGEAREATGPGRELGPVGKRQAEQLADHRERQLARVALDEVGGYVLRGQSVARRVGDGEDARLHLEDGATAEGCIDDIPQTPLVRAAPFHECVCA